MREPNDKKRPLGWPWTNVTFMSVLVLFTLGLAVVGTTLLVEMPVPHVSSKQ